MEYTKTLTALRFKPTDEVFVVHFTFATITGRELFTQPLLANNKHPELIVFNKLKEATPVSFHPEPKDEKQSFKLIDQNGYTFYNQYPGVRRDVTEEEGNYRFNLGVEYPWYQSVVNVLPRNLQYEYHELKHFLNKCVRGLREMTIIINTPEGRDKAYVDKAIEKGKALTKLYVEITETFNRAYPGYRIVSVTDRADDPEVIEIVKVSEEE